MADLLLSPLISVVLKKTTESLFQRIGEVWGINDQRERLRNMLLEIQAVLPNAEEQANSNTAVKPWLLKLESAAYEADDLLDEFCYEELRQDAVRRGHNDGNVSAFFSLENPSLLRYKMSGKLKKVLGRLDGLVVQMGRFGFVHSQRVHVANRIRTDSLVVESKIVGRDEDKEKVVQLLLQGCESDDLMVVPIVGMGGLGKTTLAQLVYNTPRVKEYFNLLLWVCVSEEFNIGHLVKSIIELVEGKCKLSVDNMELLQKHLRKVLSGKRYFLVLDDVWNEDDDAWERLRTLLNYGDSGSAIIVTTRSSRVAAIMGTVESYNLRGLGKKDSWSLFHKKAFSKGIMECEELVEIGKMMVKNCQGLPLAINALGSLMSSKSEVREWSAVLEESKKWVQRPLKDKVLPVLRLSYDHLPPNMKLCFAFCAVYPKDHEMDKDELIQFWMANGFIPSDGTSSLEIKGNDIFIELAWRSFFQKVRQVCSSGQGGYRSQTKCKMHDLMHDLAQSIMGTKCQSILKVPTQLNQIDVRHISVRTLPQDINKAIDCFPSIRSLISSDPYSTPYAKHIGFLKSNSLRILQLNIYDDNMTHITPITPNIPEKIKHLRYLEISIMGITSLPETISTLYLLQTLRLSRCWDLEKLPLGMRYLSNLRHLYIREYSRIRSMPEHLGQLNCLQILTSYIVGTDAGNGIRELSNLNNLHGQLHLYNLRKIKHVVDAREANLMAKQNLDDLALCWGMPNDIQESHASEVLHCDPFEVLDALKPCNKLRVLKIEEYQGDKLPVWLTEYQMIENLIELCIFDCRECTKVPPVEKLPYLRILRLMHLDNLRHLCYSASTSAEGGEDAREAFPSLKKMILSEIPELCSWCEGEVGNKSSLIFPKLTTLFVTNCPKLTTMPIVPLLTEMFVEGNKNLSCFATGLTTLHVLSLESHFANETLSFQPQESLNRLVLRNYNSIVPVDAKEGEVNITPTKCRTLELAKVSNILSSMSLWFWKCFTFLEYLSIYNCDSLIYWPEQVFRSLNCLTSITVVECPNFLGSQLESPVGRSLTEELLPKLHYLYIRECPNLVEIPKCSSSVQEIGILLCPKLQCFPEWLGNMTALKGLVIGACESLNSLPLNIGSLPCLERLFINDCPNLACLPEGMEGLKALEELMIQNCPKIRVLPEGMEVLKALKELRIENCPKIRVLPEGLLQNLKNLNELWINGCPHIERHFQKYGKYQPLVSEIPVTMFGKERRSGILKNLTVSFPPCKITSFSARP